MKILLIGFTKLAYMPYMNFYLNQLTRTDNEVHILYWNRDEKKEMELPYNVTLHEFKLFQEDEVAKLKKIKSFLKYRKTAKLLLSNTKFDTVIIMHTLPGVILYDLLKKSYSKKYILDYRDVTFERFSLYKKVIHKLVHHSIATFVSSDAFRVHLPNQENIFTSHNILLDSLEKRKTIKTRECSKANSIRIRYWGFIRHENINKTIINKLANDRRFEIHYHGREQETAKNLKIYCEAKNINNVFFHGEYAPQERYLFAVETDLLHNIFENDEIMQPAMSNKFYDGITLYIPQLCNKGSYMGKQIREKGIGLECDPFDENFADYLYDYYESMKWNAFEKNCDKILDEVLQDYQKGIRVIEEILEVN